MNPAEHDAAGWDFLLEWPTKGKQVGVPLDKAPPPRQALVQVKATDRDMKSWPIKLSNWHRLVSTPLPTFVLLLEFNGGDRCTAAYLAHVGSDLMGRVLRRLRELGEDSSRFKGLHRHKLSLRTSDAVSLEPPNAGAFELTASEAIGPSLNDYVVRKLELLKSLGHREATAKLDLQVRLPPEYITPDGPQDLLVDLTLGLLREVELEGGEITDVRFGIEGGIGKPLPKGTKLTVGEIKSAGDGELIFSGDDGFIDRLAVAVHVPAGLGGVVEKRRIKLRLVGQLFEAVWRPVGKDPLNIELNIPEDDSVLPLEAYREVASLMHVLGRSASGESIDLAIHVDGKVLSRGTLSDFAHLPVSFTAWADAVDNARAVVRAFRVPPDLRVSPREILVQAEALRLLRAVADGSKFTFAFGVEGPGVPDPEKPGCVPVVTEVSLGRFHLQVGWALFGQIEASREPEARPYRLVAPTPRTLHREVVVGEGEFELDTAERRQRLIDELEAEHSVIIPG
ncbi:hypothetical protein WI372_15985 [Gemmatimonadota bacterium DH-20]|uniref:DUF4365 domain-containing protein n=1 Tax=Gaopeijia maritima TaxID=3119007 RepID=A0ABU9EEJ2_9BACT